MSPAQITALLIAAAIVTQLGIHLPLRRRNLVIPLIVATALPSAFVWLFSLLQYHSSEANGWEILGALFGTVVLTITSGCALVVRKCVRSRECSCDHFPHGSFSN